VTVRELLDLDISGIRERLDKGEISSRDLALASLARIEQTSALNTFLKLDREGALRSADASDERRKKRVRLSPLDGIPVALKDVLVTEGMATSAGSKILEGWIPPYEGGMARRLRKEGAVIIGKTNCDEFAMGSSTEHSAFGSVKNPWNPEKVPGGSSGGSAAAVAASQVFVSLGTDTGGSIRQPAALCGVFGLKPTYGRVSRFGVVAFASSLDQVGPFGRSVHDIAHLLQTIAGWDPRDSTSANVPVPGYTDAIETGVKGLRLGIPEEYFIGGMNEEVDAAVKEAIKTLEGDGAEIVRVSLPHTKYALSTYYIIATAEASSNLARYDGVRYGHRADEKELRRMYAASRHKGFGAEVRRRIMLGTYVLSAGYYDAYYGKAQKVRTLIRRDFEDAFKKCDAIITPTSPVPAFSLGERLSDPLAMYLMDVFTLAAPLAGIPGMSVPCGFTRDRLPIGMQILAPWFEEARLLAIARAYEKKTDFAKQRPGS
jgi:aspartyl-tRNA(Asn)/glutamyl-tRNA(Gln) amidotransferase subunit A